jgi:hypothetical protein
MLSHCRQRTAQDIGGFGSRGFCERSDKGKQSQIPIEIFGSYSSELSEHFLDPAVKIVNRVQMIYTIIAFMANQLYFSALLHSRKLIVRSSSITQQN